MTNYNEILQNRADELLSELNNYISQIDKYNYSNEQWYLDFEDELNRLSIMDHSKKD